MNVQIPHAREIDEGVWKAHVLPEDLQVLARKEVPKLGKRSIVALTSYKRTGNMEGLQFSPSDAFVLMLGDTPEVYLLDAKKERLSLGSDDLLGCGTPLIIEELNRPKSGDELFGKALPRYLSELGKMLLRGVREKFAGDLVYKETSKKYVESPDNFWTVKIQPRDRSLRITVRGEPHTFHGISSRIELKDDMGTYSAFKLSSKDQLDDALEVIRQAAEK